MAQTLEYNSSISQVSAVTIPVFDEDMDIIQKLDDEPNDVGGLTANQLKAEFDAAGKRTQDYINNELIPVLISGALTEEARANAEAERVVNEQERVSNEEARVAKETSRTTAEANRVLAENERVAAEQNRVIAEIARASAEQARVDSTNGIVAQATAQANAAKTSADNAKASETAVANNASAARNSADAAATSASAAASSSSSASSSASAAKAAQAAAEKARDEATGAVGGDFATKPEAQGYANTAESNAKSYADQKFGSIKIPDVSGAIGVHNGDSTAHGDIRSLITNVQSATTAAQNAASSAQTAASNAQNTANSKATMSEVNAAISTALSGGAKVAAGSYTGTGKYGSSNKNSLSFDFVPKLVIVATKNGLMPSGGMWQSYCFIWTYGQTSADKYNGGSTSYIYITQSGNTLSWYNKDGASGQCNDSGTVFYYVAIG